MKENIHNITDNDYTISEESYQVFTNSSDKLNILKIWLTGNDQDYKLFSIKSLNEHFDTLKTIDEEDTLYDELFILLLTEFISIVHERARVDLINLV